MKTRRIVAALVALFMIVAMMPTAVLGDDNADGTTPGKVTASKVLVTDKGKPVIDDKGNYTIRISVAGNPIEQTVGANADVVLVIDNSGSMASFVGTLCGYNLSELNPTLENHKKTYICPECHATYIVVYDEHDETIMWSTLPDDNLCTGNKGNTPIRMEATRDLGKAFADRILSQSTNKVAVIGFAHNEYGLYVNSTFPFLHYGIIIPAVRESTGLTNSYQDVESCINAMVANGGTDYTSALQAAYNILDARTDKATRPAYVIFISDGAPGLRGDSLHDKNWNGADQITALKEAGVTVFTAGINLNDDEASYLKNMASDNKDEHFINVTGTDYYTQLDSYLTTWANKIKSSPAGTDAVLTDVVSDEFDASLPINSPATIKDNTITWKIGDIPANGSSIDILVKPKDDSYGTLHPNQSVKLTYKDYNGSDVENTDLGDPVINLAKLTINYYYDNEKAEDETKTIILDSNKNDYFTGVFAPAETVDKYTLKDVKLDGTAVAEGFNYAGIATNKPNSDAVEPADRTLDIYYEKAAPAVTYPTVTFKIDTAYNNGTING
ncbi:MAG: VWA domain-containing protein, partial [Candidatus Flemingiibacterium sp.]